MTFKVLVVDDEGVEAPLVSMMFIEYGFELVDDVYDADFMCFVGGEDVEPMLYNQHLHRTTSYNKSRDQYEKEVFDEALSLGTPMVGICRGGQFLNVMCGGTMWQDVDNHQIGGYHEAFVVDEQRTVMVNSVHHQMMEPDYLGRVQCLLRANQSTQKHRMSDVNSSPYSYSQFPLKHAKTDIEALWYPDTRCLCFQPHPEYGHKPTAEIFFKFLNDHILKSLPQMAQETAVVA